MRSNPKIEFLDHGDVFLTETFELHELSMFHRGIDFDENGCIIYRANVFGALEQCANQWEKNLRLQGFTLAKIWSNGMDLLVRFFFVFFDPLLNRLKKGKIKGKYKNKNSNQEPKYHKFLKIIRLFKKRNRTRPELARILNVTIVTIGNDIKTLVNFQILQQTLEEKKGKYGKGAKVFSLTEDWYIGFRELIGVYSIPYKEIEFYNLLKGDQ